MKHATRSRRHLPACRRRLKSIFGVIMDGVGLAVLLFVVYALITILNDYINGA